MFFITNEEEDLKDVDGKEAAESKVVELKTLEVNGEIEITLRTILGFTSKGIMKLQGIVKERERIILIDSDATYNFIHQGVAKKLSLLMEGKTKFGVTICDGTALEGKGICKRVKVKLPKLTIMVDFLVIKLGKFDVVLCM